MTGGKTIRHFLFRLLGGLFSAALLIVLAASLILAKPAAEPSGPAALPSLESGPAVFVDDERDLYQLISVFPAPVMSFMSGSGMVFVSATVSDLAVSGGFSSVATLHWQTEDGIPLTLESIWPADSLSLLEDGYHFMPYTGPVLWGQASVRMENDESVRIHASTGQALYVILLPRSLSTQVSTICHSLQLFTVNQAE